MTLSILDVFILSMLDRGAQTPYELQRTAGLSQGAAVPSLRRLLDAKLVTREDGLAATNRPRHEYRLTPEGKKAARSGWKAHFQETSSGSDLDSLLRIVDMAIHYGADKAKIKSFLKHAAKSRELMAEKAGLTERGFTSSDKASYMRMRAYCDAARLGSEGEALLRLAAPFGSKRVVEGQQSLL
jgi:DNA-binding PadR family transcriptional regulator